MARTENMATGGRMGEHMVNDAEVKVLIDRMNTNLDWQKRIEGKLDTMVQLQLTLASQQEQINGLKSGQQRLFEKSDEIETSLQPLRDDMVGNRRAVRVMAAIGSAVMAVAGFLYTQYKPWSQDIADATREVQKDLRADDNRLTVLEFRANNIDQKASK